MPPHSPDDSANPAAGNSAARVSTARVSTAGNPSAGSPAGEPAWAVLGSSGFVGAAVTAELAVRGYRAAAVAAPRLTSGADSAEDIVTAAQSLVDAAPPLVEALVRALTGVDIVVNAAGLATPGAPESAALTGANALLPAVLVLAARAAGVRRVIHLSSAAVQGHRDVLDESADRAPFSAYSRSKALGEEALELLAADGATSVVVVRATSVQGPTRHTTSALARLATSPLATVAAPGTGPTPVSSIPALTWFIVETGLHTGPVPPVVLQPWEGLDVSGVLAAAGGRAPRVLPAWLCRTALRAGYGASALAGERLHGLVRRVELMWFGQGQRPGWADRVGLRPQPQVRQVLRQASSAPR